MKPARAGTAEHRELRLWIKRDTIQALKLYAIKLDCSLSELVERLVTESLNGGHDDASS